MTLSSTLVPAGEVLAGMGALLDRLDPDRSNVDPATRLAWLRTAPTVQARVTALTAQLTGEADQAKAAEEAVGTPLASWLGMGENLSRREAAGTLRQARKLAQHRLVGEAAIAGRLGTGQARAITGVLDGLAPQLDEAQQQRAERVMVDLAGHLDADQLAKAAGQVLKTVVPDRAEEALEQHLQRQAEAAYRQRSPRFFVEGASVRFDGSLPRPAAEAWIAQLDAHAEQARRTAVERRDPLASTVTLEQRRADALIAQISRQGNSGPGSPSARVLVMLDYAKLAAGAAAAGVLPDGQGLSAGELRRLCCDAELVPVVLGGPSQVLDVGRAERLVTPQLRDALSVRDRGCVFPGCDAPPSRCEAHHILPWHQGGRTCLANLVLLCHCHHPVCEPARHSIRDQWQIRTADDGLPEFIPPARLDPHRKPVRHTRHRHPPGRPQARPTHAA
nr:HNH endonuclease signature motif containing protein [Propionicimonas sp.]